MYHQDILVCSNKPALNTEIEGLTTSLICRYRHQISRQQLDRASNKYNCFQEQHVCPRHPKTRRTVRYIYNIASRCSRASRNERGAEAYSNSITAMLFPREHAHARLVRRALAYIQVNLNDSAALFHTDQRAYRHTLARCHLVSNGNISPSEYALKTNLIKGAGVVFVIVCSVPAFDCDECACQNASECVRSWSGAFPAEKTERSPVRSCRFLCVCQFLCAVSSVVSCLSVLVEVCLFTPVVRLTGF